MKKALGAAVAAVAAGVGLFQAAMPAARAGVSGGALCFDHYVAANDTRVYRHTFRGGEWATVEATGDGDIDIYVRDARGRLVDFDDLSDEEPAASWVPPSTQTYTITIVNCEDYRVDYHYDTN